MDFYRKGPLDCEFDLSDRNEALEVLAQRIAQLPGIPKKILVMYYYENMRPAEIAAELGLTGN